MGSGKTKVGLYLLEALEDSALLDRDLNANGPIQSIDESLGKKNVIGELFYGNSHTTDPQWIKAFQERDYKILSAILNTKLETCINRVLVIRKDNSVIDNWNNELDNMNEGKEGASYVYPYSFVQLLGYMRAYFHLPYRQTEGVVIAHAKSKVPSIPDYSTIQRRINKLDIKINEHLGNDIVIALDMVLE